MPDAAGLGATERVLALADARRADDLVLVLMSGGASANWIAPAAGPLARREAGRDAGAAALGRLDRRDQHGAQASLAHQGRPARRARASGAARHARDLRRAGRRSGGDRLRSDRARSDHARRCARDRCALSPRPARGDHPRAAGPRRTRSPKPGDAAFAAPTFRLVARPADAFRAAEQRSPARPATSACFSATACRARRARSPPRTPASPSTCKAAGRRAVILSGGELTVTMRGEGRGGPNQEYALALALALGGDGRYRRPGGGYRRHRRRERQPGRSRRRLCGFYNHPARARPRPRSCRLSRQQRFERLFCRAWAILWRPGPTFTNVNDFRAILVDRP